MINITLPDGSVRQYTKGSTAMDIALSISEGLARNVLSATINGEVWDASRPINEDSLIKLHTWNDKEGKATYWHSSAHLMAEALEFLYPGTKFGIGPAIDNGFYYDVDTGAVSYTHLRAHETVLDLVCRLLLEKKKHKTKKNNTNKTHVITSSITNKYI